MLHPLSQRGAQHRGFALEKLPILLEQHRQAVWANALANISRRSTPDAQFFTFYFTRLYLALSVPTKLPICCTPSSWLHYNEAVDTLAVSPDTHRALTNCDFSGSINNPCAFLSASIQAMAGFRWPPAPYVLNSSTYHD